MFAQIVSGTVTCSLRCLSLAVRDSLAEEASLDESDWTAMARLVPMVAMSHHLGWLEATREVDFDKGWGVQPSRIGSGGRLTVDFD